MMNARATETQPLAAARTGPVGRAVRLLLAVGLAYACATLVDQGGPASVRDTEALTHAPFVVLTIAMVALYAVLVTELARIVVGEAVAKTARTAALLLGAAAGVSALVGELHAGAVWGSPYSDLAWTLDTAMLLETIVALAIAVVLGTPGPSPPRRVGGPPPHAISGRGRRSAARTPATLTRTE